MVDTVPQKREPVTDYASGFWLPEEYAVGYPGETVAAEVVEVPFRPSSRSCEG